LPLLLDLRRLFDLDRPLRFGRSRLRPELRLWPEADEADPNDPTESNRLPFMDAGDFGGSWLGAGAAMKGELLLFEKACWDLMELVVAVEDEEGDRSIDIVEDVEVAFVVPVAVNIAVEVVDGG